MKCTPLYKKVYTQKDVVSLQSCNSVRLVARNPVDQSVHDVIKSRGSGGLFFPSWIVFTSIRLSIVVQSCRQHQSELQKHITRNTTSSYQTHLITRLRRVEQRVNIKNELHLARFAFCVNPLHSLKLLSFRVDIFDVKNLLVQHSRHSFFSF